MATNANGRNVKRRFVAKANAGLRRIMLRAARFYGRLTVGWVRDGVTIVTVNWNAAECLDSLLLAVRHYSPASVKIFVIDNNSDRESRAWFRSHRDVRVLRLPINSGHSAAMDIGFCMARTEIVVSLDVDAFPISADWWDEIVGPIQAHTARVSGAGFDFVRQNTQNRQPFVHPCCLAMRRKDFIDGHHSFQQNMPMWDTGERISQREAGNLHLVPPTSTRGPGVVGTVFGSVIYHNFYATRFSGTTRDLIDTVDRESPKRAWAEAVASYIDPIRSA